MSDKVYAKVTAAIESLLEQGVAPWKRPWSVRPSDAPHNADSGYIYRGINALVLSATAFAESRSHNAWITYRQAQKRGGHVRKGERGTPILMGSGGLVIKRDEESDDETIEFVRRRRPNRGLRSATVFHLEQCEGLEEIAPKEVEAEDVEPSEARYERAEAILAAAPNMPAVFFGGGRASYSPSLHKISMPQRHRFATLDDYYATFFHELGHSTARAMGIPEERALQRDGYTLEELRAEMIAAYLAGVAGLEPEAWLASTAAYLKGWARKLNDNPTWFLEASQAAQRAARYILREDQEQEAAA